MEFDEESEPEVPIYNRAELIERYQVMIMQLTFFFPLPAPLPPVTAAHSLSYSK